MTDRDWPHQVALPAYRCLAHNYLTIHFFCEAERLSLCTRRQSYRHNDVDMTVFCFAEREHAEQFQDRFRGKLVDTVTVPGRRAWRRDLCAEQHLRNGRCINCND
jgi:hypothetical protein